MLKAQHLSVPLMIGAVFLLFSSINGYQTGALSGLEAYGSLAKAGIVSGILAVFAISLGSLLGGLNGTLIGLSISAFVRCAVHFFLLVKESRQQQIRPVYKGSLLQEKSIIYKFALPAAIAGYYSIPMIWLANSILVRQPGGYGEMGLFSAANNLRILILFLPNVINSVGLSILNNEKGKRDITQFNRVFKSNVIFIFIVSLCCVLVIGIFGRTILQFFGKEFIAGHFILWFLVCSSLFESISIALYQYIQAHSKIWLSFFYISVPREAFFVLVAYYLVKTFGGEGLGAAYLGASILGVILHISLVFILHRKESRLLHKRHK
jgi:O-antigen/teichoic acid export membrane protein